MNQPGASVVLDSADRRGWMVYGLSVRSSLALLVALLIVCQVVFVLIMWIFWRETKMELRRQLRAKEVVEQVEHIRLKQKELLLALAEASIARHELKLPEDLNKSFFAAQCAEFRTLAPKMIGLNEQLAKIGDQVDRVALLLGAAYAKPDKEQQLRYTIQLRTAMKELDELLDDMRNRFKDFRREHAEKLMLANTVDFVYMALAFVVVLSAVVLITTFFAKMIENRISTLVRNSELAAEGKSLLPPLAGADEFSTVDQAFRKMTAALQAESENLRLSESKTRTIIESLPIGLLLLNTFGEIESANNSAASLLGIDEANALHGEEFNKYFSVSIDPHKPEQTSSVDVVRKRADGVFPADVLQKPFETPEGPRVLVIFADISDRERIRKLREELVAVVSHEIRTPLTTMRAFLTLLKDNSLGQLNEDGVEYVRRMDSVTRRLVGLVNDLVDAGKIELGHLKLETQPASIGAIIESAVDSVAALASQHGVELELPDDDASVLCDADRTTQVLINLISNAIKYSPAGSVVAISLRTDAPIVTAATGSPPPEVHGGECMICVQDQGPGIPAAEQGQIFGRFAQVSGASYKRQDSSGLGLYIAKDIIEKQGGSIGVNSVEGEGSTFWFTLQLNDQT